MLGAGRLMRRGKKDPQNREDVKTRRNQENVRDYLQGSKEVRTASFSCSLKLPPDFRANDVLSFHRRDPLMAAERVDAATLQKGLTWQGFPACLIIRFHSTHADAELAIDGSPAAVGAELLERVVQRMLGLTQRVEDFEQTYRHHPQVGFLISRHPGLRVPLSPTPFEALTWAISGQQITVSAAIAMRRNLIRAAGLRHSGGLYCHPDAGRIAGMSEADLRQGGFSQAKARTLIELSRRVRDNLLPLDEWAVALPVDEMHEKLLLVPGIGPWTISYVLLRGFGWLDGSLHGDAAVRRSLQALLSHSEKVTENAAKSWLAEFSPWRALVAAHLWAMLSHRVANEG
jgi:DNA-3-methyladenine glycosylase II